MPAAFTAAELERLSAARDPRLNAAGAGAEDGRVVQFIAGAPELMARYRNAPPAAAALINAAMDARRLGMGVALPLAFLEAAAPGYLDDTDWDALTADWLEQVLAYTASPCKGTRGPLALIRPRTGDIPAPGPSYRLADYLEQHGRHARRQHIPPASFWTAARFASPTDLPALARAAEGRGLLRDAARLRKHAVAQGNTGEAATLVRHLHSLHSADCNFVEWVAENTVLYNASTAADLLTALHDLGACEHATAVASRAVEQVILEDPSRVAQLLRALQKVSAGEQVAALLRRDPAALAVLDDPSAVARLVIALREAGAAGQVRALVGRAVEHAPVDRPMAVLRLMDALNNVDSDKQMTALASRAAERVPLDNLANVTVLVTALWDLGCSEQMTALASPCLRKHAAKTRPSRQLVRRRQLPASLARLHHQRAGGGAGQSHRRGGCPQKPVRLRQASGSAAGGRQEQARGSVGQPHRLR